MKGRSAGRLKWWTSRLCEAGFPLQAGALFGQPLLDDVFDRTDLHQVGGSGIIFGSTV